MPEPEKLDAFIRAAKERGVADDAIVAILRQHGWSERRIFQSLSEHYEGVLGMPIPSRGSRSEQARDAFFYLLAFTTLGFWMVALILLADDLIDRTFPSPLDLGNPGSAFRVEAAGSIAALIIAFPLFLFVSRTIAQEVARRPEALESGARKWLTYIALVITAITLLSDAVAFLTQFLTGDLTVRFALKALVLFVVAAGVFWYYLGTVRPEPAAPSRDRSFAWAALVAVVAALALGFVNIGTPARERAYALDRRRISDLEQIASAIHREWTSAPKGTFALPNSLERASLLPGQEIRDPVTLKQFDYLPGLGTSYKLCATFDADEFSANSSAVMPWDHPAGYHCFTLDATAPQGGYTGYITQ